MTFTQEDEEILKLMAAEVKARIKLNNVNQTMGEAIRAEFSVIDKRIRDEYRPVFTPLEEDVKVAKEALKEKFR